MLHNGHKLLAVVLNQTRSGADVIVESRALDYPTRGYFSILKSDWNLHLSLTEGERIQVENFSTSESSSRRSCLSTRIRV
jgi:hypothetical protein